MTVLARSMNDPSFCMISRRKLSRLPSTNSGLFTFTSFPFQALSAAVTKQITQLAIQTYHVLGCSGAARVDFRITPKGKPYVLEINTVPGMTETSLLPMAAGKAGLSYDVLTERILQSALRRAGAGTFRAVR